LADAQAYLAKKAEEGKEAIDEARPAKKAKKDAKPPLNPREASQPSDEIRVFPLTYSIARSISSCDSRVAARVLRRLIQVKEQGEADRQGTFDIGRRQWRAITGRWMDSGQRRTQWWRFRPIAE
jgi:hypothetical protein